MNDVTTTIIEKASWLFAHYGVGKTSMNEVAKASGVARQTVYNLFDSKEDLIYAALLHYAKKSKDDVEQECAALAQPEERLEAMYKHLVQAPYEGMQTLPHLEDILEIGAGLSADRQAQIKQVYVSAILSVLAPYQDQLAAQGIDSAKLANMIKGSFIQIKREANDMDHLRDLFEPIRALVMIAVSKHKQT